MRYVPYMAEGATYLIPESLAAGGVSVPISRAPAFTTPSLDPAFAYDRHLQEALEGKALLPDEISFTVKTLHSHYWHGYLTYTPGIKQENHRYVCQRCGNETQRLFASFSCARCRASCVYCRKCLLMGRVSTCTPLLRWCGPETTYARRGPLSVWGGELSPGQKQASQAVVTAVDEGKELLIWAVCGAGKTEVLYAGIEKALQAGLRVAMASPRTDVITELAPRFAAVFPEVAQAALYGGSGDHGTASQLLLATTHQLLRFQDSFDVVVIDEVDAFPFDHDESLAYAVQKAAKPSAATIYLTATPDQPMKRRLQMQTLSAVKIPRRYHGYPLPVPRLQWCGNWEKQLQKQRLPAVISEWVRHHCEGKRPAFLFVPSISVMRQVAARLQTIVQGVEAVHAGDADRREKVDRFRNGETRVLVTTTILERGVTVPHVEVGILGADHDVFTERALVQMAGRVGRSAQAPDGDVCFFHYGKTKAMIAACKHITAMNDTAVTGEGGEVDDPLSLV